MAATQLGRMLPAADFGRDTKWADVSELVLWANACYLIAVLTRE